MCQAIIPMLSGHWAGAIFVSVLAVNWYEIT